MRTDLIIGVVAVCALFGCRKDISRTESGTGASPGLAIRTQKNARISGVDEVSLLTAPGSELICRVITQRGRVVSLLPTPIGSDDLHSYAGFRPVGNGWHPISFIDLDETGKLTIGGRQGLAIDERRWQDLVNHQEQVYVVVEQNAPYSNLLAIAKQLAARTNGTFGIGWKARYPELEDVSNQDERRSANHTSDGIRQPADGSPKPSR